MRRERRRVTGVEQVGPYTLLRVDARRPRRGRAGPVLHARGARPAAAAADERLPRGGRRARVPDRPDRAGDAGALLARARGASCTCSARSATASTSTSSGRCSSAAGSGSRRCRTSPQRLGGPPAILGFRTDWHAEAAALVPNAEVCVEPTYVTELLPDEARRRARLRAGADARGAPRAGAGRPARLGGADGVRLRRLLRLRRRDRRRAEAPLRRRAGAPCCLTRPAASTR